MELQQVDGIEFHHMVDDLDVQIGQIGEQAVHMLLLILVDHGDGGVLKVDQGDQTLKVAGEHGQTHEILAVALDHEVTVGLQAARPIPAVRIGKGDIVLPVGQILDLGGAGLDHGAADIRRENPLHAEHIRAAEFRGRHAVGFQNHAAHLVFRQNSGPEGLDFAELGHPQRQLLTVQRQEVFLGRDGGVEDHHIGIGAAGGILAQNVQFLGGEGDSVHGFKFLSHR